MTRHAIAAAKRRRARPLRFHWNGTGPFCPGHPSRRAADAALRSPGAGPVDVCLCSRVVVRRAPGVEPRWTRMLRVVIPNHSA